MAITMMGCNHSFNKCDKENNALPISLNQFEKIDLIPKDTLLPKMNNNVYIRFKECKMGLGCGVSKRNNALSELQQ